MSSHDDRVKTRDGLVQYRRHWPAVDPWAALLLIHGIGEHSGRYQHVGDHFSAAGIDVTAIDLRGFGESGGRRAYVDSFSQYLDDVEDRLAEVRVAGLPTVLLGHSMGGLVGSRYAQSDRPQPDYLVLSAPSLGAEVPAWQRVLSRLLHKVVPKLSIPGKIDPTVLSIDEAVQQGYVDDPLVETSATVNLGHEMFSAMDAATAEVAKVRVPTLVLHGGDDTLVHAKFSAPLGGVAGVRRELLPGLRHEIFNEPNHAETLDRVVEWLRDQTD